MQHPPDVRRTPRDVIDLLIDEGSVWLSKIRPNHRHHTFTVIAYDERGKPHVT
jgi:hypothetical protein